MANEEQLKQLRDQIDAIDEQIQELISRRADCAHKVGEVKRATGEDVVFYRPEREAQILRRVKERNRGPLAADEMARLFREIVSTCLALEQQLSVVYLGPEGSYTHTAAIKHFGKAVKPVPVAAIDETFREVEAGSADYGVVPVENSTEGVVNHTLDMFMRSPLKICGEVELRIHHHLLSKESDVKKIKRIYSHQQSFAQCREWLNANMAGVEQIVVGSNAVAAKRAAEEPGTAAIAGETAGSLYELNSLFANIEDSPDNTTRFLVIGKHMPGPSGADKTSLLLSVKNRPGALYGLLEPFRRHGISLTRIESRPSRRQAWDYVFFVDLEGHAQDEHVQQALSELSDEAVMVNVLGAYPKAVFKG
ncbi:MAG: prephenate dehydratase [Gammaproteobacteria bacterium]|nr:prephenate dehydratase [Gammaproteobacteria bacterium]